jgi:hypothetical protein
VNSRYIELQNELQKDLSHTEYAKINKELTHLSPIATKALDYDKLVLEMSELREVIKTETGADVRLLLL